MPPLLSLAFAGAATLGSPSGALSPADSFRPSGFGDGFGRTLQGQPGSQACAEAPITRPLATTYLSSAPASDITPARPGVTLSNGKLISFGGIESQPSEGFLDQTRGARVRAVLSTDPATGATTVLASSQAFDDVAFSASAAAACSPQAWDLESLGGATGSDLLFFPLYYSGFGMVQVDSKLYVIGGAVTPGRLPNYFDPSAETLDYSFACRSAVFIFDLSSNSWSLASTAGPAPWLANFVAPASAPIQIGALPGAVSAAYLPSENGIVAIVGGVAYGLDLSVQPHVWRSVSAPEVFLSAASGVSARPSFFAGWRMDAVSSAFDSCGRRLFLSTHKLGASPNDGSSLAALELPAPTLSMAALFSGPAPFTWRASSPLGDSPADAYPQTSPTSGYPVDALAARGLAWDPQTARLAITGGMAGPDTRSADAFLGLVAFPSSSGPFTVSWTRVPAGQISLEAGADPALLRRTAHTLVFIPGARPLIYGMGGFLGDAPVSAYRGLAVPPATIDLAWKPPSATPTSQPTFGSTATSTSSVAALPALLSRSASPSSTAVPVTSVDPTAIPSNSPPTSASPAESAPPSAGASPSNAPAVSRTSLPTRTASPPSFSSTPSSAASPSSVRSSPVAPPSSSSVASASPAASASRLPLSSSPSPSPDPVFVISVLTPVGYDASISPGSVRTASSATGSLPRIEVLNSARTSDCRLLVRVRYSDPSSSVTRRWFQLRQTPAGSGFVASVRINNGFEAVVDLSPLDATSAVTLQLYAQNAALTWVQASTAVSVPICAALVSKSSTATATRSATPTPTATSSVDPTVLPAAGAAVCSNARNGACTVVSAVRATRFTFDTGRFGMLKQASYGIRNAGCEVTLRIRFFDRRAAPQARQRFLIQQTDGDASTRFSAELSLANGYLATLNLGTGPGSRRSGLFGTNAYWMDPAGRQDSNSYRLSFWDAATNAFVPARGASVVVLSRCGSWGLWDPLYAGNTEDGNRDFDCRGDGDDDDDDDRSGGRGRGRVLAA